MKKPTILFFVILSSICFLQMDCKDDEPIIPPDDKPPVVDTTSHNFVWTTYTFGGNAGSSYFKDVAIINDSDIWAVGAINTSPETTYNAAHWDGKKWNLIRLYYNVSSLISFIRGIYVISSENVYLAAGSIFHWNGSSQQTELVFSRLSLPDANATIEKIWGASGNNIFGVGNSGTIVHYNGNNWSKQESGTTIDLRDVWGSPDGKTVWVCGSSIDNLHSILLKYENNQWKIVWQRDGTGSVPPYGFNVASVWSKKQATYITSSNGVFRMQDSIPVKMPNNFSDFSKCLRGNSEYDMLTVGNGGRIWHYNGVGWKAVADSSENYLLNSGGLNGNTAVAVGTDYSISFGAGLVRMGKRNE